MILVELIVVITSRWGGGEGFLKIMGSSLFFSYFLNSHVQVSFCSLFLFLSCTRAAERLGVQL